MVRMKIEEYLETIFEISQRKGYARVIDVARHLKIGSSAVSEMFRKLGKDGHINYEKYSGVTLTKKGEKIAIDLMRRHKALKEFLMILGLDEKTSDEDACRIEHVVRPNTMKRLALFVQFVQSHQNPLWLERFKKYYQGGKLEECPESIKRKRTLRKRKRR